jgi:hypothetical protein
MVIAAPVSPIDVNLTFPRSLDTSVARDHLLDSIEDLFTEGCDAVFVDGPAGIGKTTLLATFAQRAQSRAISLFLRSSSRWAHDADLLHMELCNQMHWIVRGTQLSSIREADESLFRDCLVQLQRLARGEAECYYFIIDGLDELGVIEKSAIAAILDLIPFGSGNFKFLLSGDPETILADRRLSLSTKSFRPPAFSPAEIRIFLARPDLDNGDIRRLHDVCRGFPGKLASVKRLLARGLSLDDILDSPNTRADLFEIECRSLDALGEGNQLVTAIIAHDRVARTAAELSEISGRPPDEVEDVLGALNFLVVDEATREITFASDSLRALTADRLRRYKRPVAQLLIEYSLRDPDSNAAVRLAPFYMHEAGEHERLLDYLNYSRFDHMLDGSQSTTFVKQRGELALSTAVKLERVPDSLRFSLQQAVLRDVHVGQRWRIELDALLATGQIDEAVALAHRTFLKEERLHALSVVAHALKERDREVAPEVSREIEALINDIDLRGLGKRAAEIAGELITVLPRLAIRVAERSDWESDNNPDWGLASLSIASSQHELDDESAQSLATLRNRIQDPVLRLLAKKAGSAVSSHSAISVLNQVAELENPADQLFLLKTWTTARSDSKDAAPVVRAALDLLVKTTEYRPSIADLRRIATPLPALESTADLLEFVERLSGFAVALEPLGPTDEYVRLQMLLARAEMRIDVAKSRQRALETYFYVAPLTDLTTRVTALAWLARALPDIDLDGALEAAEGLEAVALAEVSTGVDEILMNSARHVDVMRSMLRALSKNHLGLALELCARLNTEPRRDSATYWTLDSALHLPNVAKHVSPILDHLGRFVNMDMRDALLAHVLSVLASKPEAVDSATLTRLGADAASIRDISVRAEALAHIHKLLNTIPTLPLDRRAVFESLRSAWQLEEDPWRRIENGFKLVSLISDTPDDARALLDDVRVDQRTLDLDTTSRASTFYVALQLCVRSFAAVAAIRREAEHERERLLSLIEQIASPVMRAELANDLVCRLFAVGRSDAAQEIFREQLEPLINLSVSGGDLGMRLKVIDACIGAFVVASPAAARAAIERERPIDRDALVMTAITFLLFRMSSMDPYDDEYCPFVGTHEDLRNASALLELCYSDDIVAGGVDLVLRGASGRLTTQQQVDLTLEVEKLINGTLPNPRFIVHAGYSIVCRARLARSRKQTKLAEWRPLLDEIEKIPNVADRVLVRALVAAVMPTKLEPAREAVIASAIAEINTIPSIVDRLDRFESLASEIRAFAPKRSKEILRAATESLLSDRSGDHISAMRRIVDTAYKVDPSFAESLVQLSDDDPVRRRLTKGFKDRLSVHRLKQSLTDGEVIEPSSETGGQGRWSSAAWMLLRSLNSGRSSPLKPHVLLTLTEEAGRRPLRTAYPALALIVESQSRKYRRDPTNGPRNLRPLLEASMRIAELAYRLSSRDAKTHAEATALSSSANVLVTRSSPEAGVEFVEEWLRRAAPNHLIVCDPYFSADSLSMLKVIQGVAPDCHVQILTGRRLLEQTRSDDLQVILLETWRSKFSDQAPPHVDITLVSPARRPDCPIHDRWWLTPTAGLRFGSSWNGLGTFRTSEISQIEPAEAVKLRIESESYLNRSTRFIAGDRLSYSLISL